MCGIYGKIRFDGGAVTAAEVERACDAMRHRGPDDAGVFVDGSVGLGHRRLSIIDLSPLGHQPMASDDGRLRLVFNGEIYNFRELRRELEAEGHAFRSRTDTEVLLRLFQETGPGCVERLRGMFAFAIWDSRDRTLFLARDRVGKKPLFYHRGPRFFAFASELAALVADPQIPREVDPEALHHYLTYQSVPAPFSIYRGVRKLRPAYWLRVGPGGAEERRYWRLPFVPKHPADTPVRRRGLEDELLARLSEAVRVRMVSDVPLGALLSGGVDSSAVVALMAREDPGRPVRTFSVGFEEKEYDELRFACLVAERYATEHTEVVLRPAMLDVLPILVERFGEPFADSSAIPTFHVARAARRAVTVVLCGDGGDENFAGYERHRLHAFLHRFDSLPAWLSAAVFRALRPLPHGRSPKNPVWIAKRFFQCMALPPAVRNVRFFGNFDNETKSNLYAPDFAARVEGIDSDDIAGGYFREAGAPDLVDAILYSDIHTYLPDTLLPKVDVTSMANSLEVRSPLLDHPLMEFVARLPADLKLRGSTSKYLLKEVLRPLLPGAVLDRPKMGFGVPLERWFRQDLRELVRDTLLSPRALGRGYFRPGAVERLIDDHEQGRWQRHYQIYNLLMLEQWHRRFLDGDRDA
jgi:asparagine synthase (glutamine-hydrolysing)